MSSRNCMLVRVARETQALHAPADTDRLALMHVKDAAEYRAFLGRVYGLESEVELAATAVLGHERTPVAGMRTRIGRLRADLVALGMTDDEIGWLPRARTVVVGTRAEALGALYAVERTALVSGLIHRYLVARLPVVATACGYLDAYGSTAGARLRGLGDFMTEQVQQGLVTQDAVVTAATNTFRAQRQWYRRRVRSVSGAQVAERIKSRDAA